MKNSSELAGRFREVILNGTWIANTNLKNELTGLDWEVAVTRVGSLNTIAILAQHIHYYVEGIRNVLSGGKLEISDKFSFDFPLFRSQAEWDSFLERFWLDAEEFASLVENLTTEELDAYFVGEKYGTYRRNIDGMIEHSYYHLGQIVLIKKILAVNQPSEQKDKTQEE